MRFVHYIYGRVDQEVGGNYGHLKTVFLHSNTVNRRPNLPPLQIYPRRLIRFCQKKKKEKLSTISAYSTHLFIQDLGVEILTLYPLKSNEAAIGVVEIVP